MLGIDMSTGKPDPSTHLHRTSVPPCVYPLGFQSPPHHRSAIRIPHFPDPLNPGKNTVSLPVSKHHLQIAALGR